MSQAINPWRNSSTVPLDPHVSCFTCCCTGKLSVQCCSLNDNISDALPDKRNKNTSVEWKAGEIPVTPWSTRQGMRLILLYADLTQHLLGSGVINTSTRIPCSPGDNAVPRVWPCRRRQAWYDNLTMAKTDTDVRRGIKIHLDKVTLVKVDLFICKWNGGGVKISVFQTPD